MSPLVARATAPAPLPQPPRAGTSSFFKETVVPVKLLVIDKNRNVIRPEQYFGGFVSYTDTDGSTELDVDYSSFFHLNGTQLHPGESRSFTVNLRLPTERQQCIAEQTTYTFYVVIIGYQWNEFP
jgi:hypothetical protein